MKKKIILVMTMLLACGCEFKIAKNEINNNTNTSLNNEVIEPKEEYVDQNPVKISLYVDNITGGLDRAKSEIHETWVKKKDIIVFGSVLSEDEELASDWFQNIWRKNAEKYKDNEYKVGWHVSFSLSDGTKYDELILRPSAVEKFYDYLEIYLYNSLDYDIGQWHSHLLEEELKDDTIITEMKLTAGSKCDEIYGPITVSVFTYDSDDDFDSNNHYRGNNIHSVKVYND